MTASQGNFGGDEDDDDDDDDDEEDLDPEDPDDFDEDDDDDEEEGTEEVSKLFDWLLQDTSLHSVTACNCLLEPCLKWQLVAGLVMVRPCLCNLSCCILSSGLPLTRTVAAGDASKVWNSLPCWTGKHVTPDFFMSAFQTDACLLSDLSVH